MYDVWGDMNFEHFSLFLEDSLPYWYLFCFHLQASSRLEDPSAHSTKGFLRYHGDWEEQDLTINTLEFLASEQIQEWNHNKVGEPYLTLT